MLLSGQTIHARVLLTVGSSDAVTRRMLRPIAAPGRMLAAEELLFEGLDFMRGRGLDAVVVPVAAGGVQPHQVLTVLVKEGCALHRGLQPR